MNHPVRFLRIVHLFFGVNYSIFTCLLLVPSANKMLHFLFFFLIYFFFFKIVTKKSVQFIERFIGWILGTRI